MKKSYVLLLIILLLILSLALASCTTQEGKQVNDEQGRETGQQEHSSSDTEVALSDHPYEDVSDEEKAALDAALDNEYKMRTVYGSFITKFGAINPFVNSINAKQVHIDELLALYEKYELVVSENQYKGLTVMVPSLKDACLVGMDAENDTVALYEMLLSQVDNEDITAVFSAVQATSRNKDVPAFKRCVEREQ